VPPAKFIKSYHNGAIYREKDVVCLINSEAERDYMFESSHRWHRFQKEKHQKSKKKPLE
jgi:hypothetical protein